MKTITESAGGVTVAEDIANDASGKPAGRHWSFATIADAAKQEAEFAAELAAAPKELRDKFAAAKAPRLADDEKG